jgi:hypothetical protein
MLRSVTAECFIRVHIYSPLYDVTNQRERSSFNYNATVIESYVQLFA